MSQVQFFSPTPLSIEFENKLNIPVKILNWGPRSVGKSIFYPPFLRLVSKSIKGSLKNLFEGLLLGDGYVQLRSLVSYLNKIYTLLLN